MSVSGQTLSNSVSDACAILGHVHDDLSVNQVAHALGCSPASAYRYCTTGLNLPDGTNLILESYMLSGKRHVPFDAVRKFAQSQIDFYKRDPQNQKPCQSTSSQLPA